MENTTIVVLAVMTIATAVVITLIRHRRGQRSNIPREVEALVSRWKGWVEVSNSEFNPMFQGVILGKAGGWDGILLAGILIEENIPTPLVEAIKKTNPVYASEGRILVRCLSAHDQDFILSQLKQTETISLLEPLVATPDQISTRVLLSSMYLDHMDNPDGIQQFDSIWKDSMKQMSKPHVGQCIA